MGGGGGGGELRDIMTRHSDVSQSLSDYHPQNDSAGHGIAGRGSDESHFNVSLTARPDKVTRQCPQITTKREFAVYCRFIVLVP